MVVLLLRPPATAATASPSCLLGCGIDRHRASRTAPSLYLTRPPAPTAASELASSLGWIARLRCCWPWLRCAADAGRSERVRSAPAAPRRRAELCCRTRRRARRSRRRRSSGRQTAAALRHASRCCSCGWHGRAGAGPPVRHACRDNARLVAELAVREAELRHQAFHDGLTGLANRALFDDRRGARPRAAPQRPAPADRAVLRPRRLQARQRHARPRRPATPCSCGWPSGCAEPCAAATPWPGWAGTSSPCCSRTASEVDGAEATSLTRRRGPAAPRSPWTAGSLTVSASIGLTVGRGARPRRRRADALLAQADTAMYAAKRGGKAAGARVRGRAWSLAEVRERRMAEALRLGGLRAATCALVYQPIVDVCHGRGRGRRGAGPLDAADGRPVPPDGVRPAGRAQRADGPAHRRCVLDLACAQAGRLGRALGQPGLRVGREPVAVLGRRTRSCPGRGRALPGPARADRPIGWSSRSPRPAC